MPEARRREFDMTDAALTKRGVADAAENGHVIRRAARKNVDEVLNLRDDELHVATREYAYYDTIGDYHCSCGEHFDGVDDAEEHLKAAKEGEIHAA